MGLLVNGLLHGKRRAQKRLRHNCNHRGVDETFAPQVEKMATLGKKRKAAEALVDPKKLYSMNEASDLIKKSTRQSLMLLLIYTFI